MQKRITRKKKKKLKSFLKKFTRLCTEDAYEKYKGNRRADGYFAYIKQKGYKTPIQTFRNGSLLRVIPIEKIKPGDIIKEYLGESKEEERFLTVTGKVYFDGIDNMIPAKTPDGEEIHYSPLCVY